MKSLVQHYLFMPISLFMITIVGLITALIGDGWWNIWAWLLLLIPIVYCVSVLKKGFSDE